MANNRRVMTHDTSSSWTSFKMPEGGSASEMKRSVAELRATVSQEKKVFCETYLPSNPSKIRQK